MKQHLFAQEEMMGVFIGYFDRHATRHFGSGQNISSIAMVWG